MPKVVINNYSKGSYGEAGQYLAPDTQAVKELVNLIPRKKGGLAPRNGIEELDVKLMPHDKVTPFLFREEVYYLVYDPLLQRKFANRKDTNASFWLPDVPYDLNTARPEGHFYARWRLNSSFDVPSSFTYLAENLDPRPPLEGEAGAAVLFPFFRRAEVTPSEPTNPYHSFYLKGQEILTKYNGFVNLTEEQKVAATKEVTAVLYEVFSVGRINTAKVSLNPILLSQNENFSSFSGLNTIYPTEDSSLDDYTNIIENQFDQHSVDFKQDSYWWERWIVYDSKGKVVSATIERPILTEENSSAPSLGSIPSSSKSFQLLGEISPSELEGYRNTIWGDSPCRYEVIANTDAALAYDRTGTLPPVLINIPNALCTDLRCVYHTNSFKYVKKVSHLSLEAFAEVYALTFEQIAMWVAESTTETDRDFVRAFLASYGGDVEVQQSAIARNSLRRTNRANSWGLESPYVSYQDVTKVNPNNTIGNSFGSAVAPRGAFEF